MAELVLGQAAIETAAHLVAEFRDARIDHRLVVLVILIHRVPFRKISNLCGKAANGDQIEPLAADNPAQLRQTLSLDQHGLVDLADRLETLCRGRGVLALLPAASRAC